MTEPEIEWKSPVFRHVFAKLINNRKIKHFTNNFEFLKTVFKFMNNSAGLFVNKSKQINKSSHLHVFNMYNCYSFRNSNSKRSDDFSLKNVYKLDKTAILWMKLSTRDFDLWMNEWVKKKRWMNEWMNEISLEWWTMSDAMPRFNLGVGDFNHWIY